MNWALIRSATPPHVPEPVDLTCFASKDKETMAGGGDEGKKSNNHPSSHHDPDYIDLMVVILLSNTSRLLSLHNCFLFNLFLN